MAANKCPRCAASFAEADGFFAAEGLVCARCHANEEAADALRFQAATDGDTARIADPLTSTKTRTEVRADGTVITHTESTTIDAGPLNMVVGFVRRLFGRRDE